MSRSSKSIIIVGNVIYVLLHVYWFLLTFNFVCSSVPDEHEYKIPQKAVKSPMDMQLWEKSEAYSVCIFLIYI